MGMLGIREIMKRIDGDVGNKRERMKRIYVDVGNKRERE